MLQTLSETLSWKQCSGKRDVRACHKGQVDKEEDQVLGDHRDKDNDQVDHLDNALQGSLDQEDQWANAHQAKAVLHLGIQEQVANQVKDKCHHKDNVLQAKVAHLLDTQELKVNLAPKDQSPVETTCSVILTH